MGRAAPVAARTVALMSQEREEAAAVQCPVRAALDHLCQELNLDVDSASEALRDFTALRGTYSLEVGGGLSVKEGMGG